MLERNAIQSIERALDIIEATASEQDGQTLTELSAITKLPKSTAFRIILTLTERGYLSKTLEGKYKIGYKLIETVSYYINELELQTEARPYIAEMSTHLGLAAYLGVLEGDKVVYLEKRNVSAAAKLYSGIGVRVSAYCSSLGKCLLSNYSNEQLDAILADCSFVRFTPHTIPDIEALRHELTKVRKQGWAMDDEEFEPGQRCIGAPVYDYKGDIVAAVGASGEKHILTDERIPEVAAYIMRIASEISKAIGHTE